MATFGLRRTVDDGVEPGHEVKEFIARNFNVDGGLVLKPATAEVLTLVRSTQSIRASVNLTLHKVVLSVSMIEALNRDDLVKDIHSLACIKTTCQLSIFLGFSGSGDLQDGKIHESWINWLW